MNKNEPSQAEMINIMQWHIEHSVWDKSNNTIIITAGLLKYAIDEIKRQNNLITPMQHYLKTLHRECAVDEVVMRLRSYRPLAECLELWGIK